jgi:hypothetical protein
MGNKLIIKYNNGMGAILCSGCRKIIKEGFEYTEEEYKYSRGGIDHLPPQYCEQCKSKQNERTNS